MNSGILNYCRFLFSKKCDNCMKKLIHASQEFNIVFTYIIYIVSIYLFTCIIHFVIIYLFTCIIHFVIIYLFTCIIHFVIIYLFTCIIYFVIIYLFLFILLLFIKGTGRDFCWSGKHIYHLQKQRNKHISKNITKSP